MSRRPKLTKALPSPKSAPRSQLAAGEMAKDTTKPRLSGQEARKRKFSTLPPNTASLSRHRQLSRLPGHLNRPRASDFFYDMPDATTADKLRDGMTATTSRTSPQTGHVPPGQGRERINPNPQGKGHGGRTDTGLDYGGDSRARTGTGSYPNPADKRPRKETQEEPKWRPEKCSSEMGRDRLTAAFATRGEHLGATHT